MDLYTETKSGKGKQQRLKIGKGRYPRVYFIDAFQLDHLQPAKLSLFQTFPPQKKRGRRESAEAGHKFCSILADRVASKLSLVESTYLTYGFL